MSQVKLLPNGFQQSEGNSDASSMASAGEDVYDDDEAACSSTLQYLADNGFIDPSYDSSTGLRAAVQRLQDDMLDDEEIDELADDIDDLNDDEIAHMIEPTGINPQQTVLMAHPAGPSSSLLDEGKALITRAPLPQEKWIEDSPKPSLRFDGADEIVMTRAALKDTPVIPRKSTFKPLIAKTSRVDLQDAIKSIKVPETSDAEDPPVPIKPIDGYLKLGLAASRGLLTRTQSVLASVQNVMKREPGGILKGDMGMQEDLELTRPPTPVLFPRLPKDSSRPTVPKTPERLNIHGILQENIVLPKTVSSPGMTELMHDVDRWGGGVPPFFSPVTSGTDSTKASSPFVGKDAVVPVPMSTPSYRNVVNLARRGAKANSLKRDLSTSGEDDVQVQKKVKYSVTKGNATTMSDSNIKKPAPDVHTVPTRGDPSQQDMLTSSPSVAIPQESLSKSTEDSHIPNGNTSPLKDGNAPLSMTLATLNQMYDNYESEEEIDELASNIDEIESFHDLVKTPELGTPDTTTAAIPSMNLDTTLKVEKDNRSTTALSAKPSAQEEQQPQSALPTESDKIVFTPPYETMDDSQESGDSVELVSAREPVAHRSLEGTRDSLDCLDVDKTGSFFSEERTYVKPVQSSPKPSQALQESVKPLKPNDKPRVPLTHLSTEALAALVGSKRKKKVEKREASNVPVQQNTREASASEVFKKDFKNVNGYLVLRSRPDLVKTPPPRLQAAEPVAKPRKEKEATPKETALQAKSSPPKKPAPRLAESALPLKPTQKLTRNVEPASTSKTQTAAVAPVYDTSKLSPIRCFGSFRLLQNSAVDRALGQHKIEVIYPEEEDPVSIRAKHLSKTKRQQVSAQITQPDIILSPRSCLFYYRLSDIYKLTTVLDSNVEQRRMHHSKILIEAIKLLSGPFDKIVLVFEAFEPVETQKDPAKAGEEPSDPITPPIRRVLEKLHTDIGTLVDEMQRPVDDELQIDMLFATSPRQAAAFARGRLEKRFAEDIQLGQLGWDESLYKLFGLNDLSAHYLVIEAGSLENLQEMDADERSERFSKVLGTGRMNQINTILRSEAAFGALTKKFVTKPNHILPAMEDEKMDHGYQKDRSPDPQHDSSHADGFFEDPNYIPYNYPPESFSQANLSQANDTFVNARSMYVDNQGIGSGSSPSIRYSGEDSSMLTPVMSSSQHHLNLDDLDDLILDDADVEAELNEPTQRLNVRRAATPVMRPFTPVHEIRMDNFWSQQQPNQQVNQAMEEFDYGGNNDRYAFADPGYDGGYGGDGDGPVYEGYDPLETFSEFDPDQGMMDYGI